MRFIILITAMAGLAAASPVLDVEKRDSKPNPSEVYVESVSWAGTGCPPGSVDAKVLEAGTLVSLAFSKYVAATGPGESAANARKNCDVRVTLHYPQGWSWTVASTDLRGYAQLPEKCSGKVGATYFFSGQQQQASAMVPFKGPYDDNYNVHTEVGQAALVWAKCGAKGPLFNVNSQAVLTCDKKAMFSVDTQDTKFEMKLHLQWKKC
ncbi:uncharacterized protein ALTATR162_LOCUS7819 [Alternaria atra]|uniref:Secreted protein n=1 Tax=Alternaria atra TaxID=119953 RepID=A0A8J2IBP7_9PLEO|nr:uncharacterized protein ALTATR162_LOCUS7819 [Alternaria atra]CAG5174594.1 unnamed protein product [Alternaria atra]